MMCSCEDAGLVDESLKCSSICHSLQKQEVLDIESRILFFQALVDALLRGGWRDGEAVCVAQDLIMKRHCTGLKSMKNSTGRHVRSIGKVF